MNDFLINAIVAEDLGNIGGLQALDGIDVDTAVVADALGNGQAVVDDADDVPFVKDTFDGGDADGQEAGTAVDDGVAAAFVDDEPALGLAARYERFFECSGVSLALNSVPTSSPAQMRLMMPSSLPEAMTMSTSAAVAMEAAWIFVYMPPVPMLEPASPAIS